MTPDDTKARIRAVAIELFTRQGYEQTSLREIAERVGMTKASLYYHYPSKQALLSALVQPLIDDLAAVLPGVEERPHTPETVRAALGTFLEIMLRHRTAWALCTRDSPAVLAALDGSWAGLLALSERIRAWLAGPAPDPGDRVRALAATDVLASAVSSAVVLPDVAADIVRRTLLDCAVTVLGATAGAGGTRSADRGLPSGTPHPGVVTEG